MISTVRPFVSGVFKSTGRQPRSSFRAPLPPAFAFFPPRFLVGSPLVPSSRFVSSPTHLKLHSSMRSMRPCASRGEATAIARAMRMARNVLWSNGMEPSWVDPMGGKSRGGRRGGTNRDVDRRGAFMIPRTSAGNGGKARFHGVTTGWFPRSGTIAARGGRGGTSIEEDLS
eukprot:scaffold1401_cov330-Pavlova_lutheri.AAC.36